MRGSVKRLWRSCARLVDSLDIPDPFEPEAFVRALAHARGRRIELVPLAITGDGPCGALVSTAEVDYVVYPANTTSLHAEHILLHEIGHLTFGHSGAPAARQELPTSLLPNVSPELVGRMLGRTAYSDTSERQAELFASMVLRRCGRRRADPQRRQGPGGQGPGGQGPGGKGVAGGQEYPGSRDHPGGQAGFAAGADRLASIFDTPLPRGRRRD